MKINKKIKIVTLEIGNILKIKLKFLGYSEKPIGCHLTPKKVLLELNPVG